MKAAEPKSSTTSQSLQTKSGNQQSPFFDKEGANGLLSSCRQPFFSLDGGSSKPFFSKTGIQTKLTIGKPGDKYEQEADAMADQVVQRLAENNNASEQSALKIPTAIQRKPIFESESEPKIQAKSINGHSPKTTVIQPKCAECEQEEQIQDKKKISEEEQVQMKPISDSTAPPPGEDTVQRACAECAEEEKLQAQAEGTDAPAALTSLESRLQSSKGGGSSLPENTRSQMEGAFGTDFSGVRVHTDSSAVQMSKELGAQAFTHGADVYFNVGKYSPSSSAGQKLLAHELTHTLQQGGTPHTNQIENKSINSSENNKIQRTSSYYLPLRGGNAAHTDAETVLGRENSNLFIEMNIPGANEYSVGDQYTGRPDIVKSNNTIGIHFNNNEPGYLRAYRRLKKGTSRYNHIGNAAPAGTGELPARFPTRECRNFPYPGICRLNNAPPDIKIGDIKPPVEADRILGRRQVSNYVTGVRNTARNVNSFITSNPGNVSSTTSWNPNVTPIGTGDINIPSAFEYPNRSSVNERAVMRYYQGRMMEREGMLGASVRAHLYLVLDPRNAGIIYYEYVPVNSGYNTESLARDTTEAKRRLENLKQSLRENPQVRGKLNKHKPIQRKKTLKTTNKIQKRVEDNFRFNSWRGEYTQWRNRIARPYIRRNGASIIDLVILQEIKQRSFHNLDVPRGARDIGIDFRRIQHWEDHGLIYGRLRAVFGRVYVKVVNLYERIKTRFTRLLNNRRASRRGASGIAGAIGRVAVIALREISQIIIRQVSNRLISAFQNGTQTYISQLLNDPDVETIETRIQDVQRQVEQLNNFAQQNLDQVIQQIVDPYQERIEQIQQVATTMHDIADIFNKVKWAVRIASCGLPPGLGCLWGVGGSVIAEAILERVVNSCEFKRDVLFPALNSTEFVTNLPNQLTDLILNQLRDVIPESLRPLIGEPDRSPLLLSASDITCNRDPLTPEQQALMDLYDHFGEERMQAFFDMMQHRGASASTHMTMEQIQEIQRFLETSQLTEEEMRRIIEQTPPAETTASLTSTLEGIDAEAIRNGEEFQRGTGEPLEAGATPTNVPVEELAEIARSFPLWERLASEGGSIYYFSPQQRENAVAGQILPGLIYVIPERRIRIVANVRVEIVNISSEGENITWNVIVRSVSEGVTEQGQIYRNTDRWIGMNDIVRFRRNTPQIIQPKLTIGQPNDKYEQEADVMADQVVQRLAENNHTDEQATLRIPTAIQRKPIFERSRAENSGQTS